MWAELAPCSPSAVVGVETDPHGLAGGAAAVRRGPWRPFPGGREALPYQLTPCSTSPQTGSTRGPGQRKALAPPVAVAQRAVGVSKGLLPGGDTTQAAGAELGRAGRARPHLQPEAPE